MIDRAAFAEHFNVPRETLEKLDQYALLLLEWQTRMNLVGPSTLPHVWHRHFADSAQLLPLSGSGKHWLDIGAGAGFPGLIIATLDPAARVTLVESIAKKCRFLETVARELELDDRVTVENRRIEALPRQTFDIITARALASLEKLMHWGRPYSGQNTLWLLPKGMRWSEELIEAKQKFRFEIETRPSLTDPEARLLLARAVTPL